MKEGNTWERFWSYRVFWLIGLYCVSFAVISTQASGLFVWVILIQLGYIYVSAATNERKDPLMDRFGHTMEYTKLYISAFVLYWLGPFKTIPISIFSQIASPLVFFEGFEGENRVTLEGTFWEYIFFMMSCYILPLFIGLHWSYLNVKGIRFTAKGISKMSSTTKGILFAFNLFIIIPFVGYHIWLFVLHDIWLWYLIGFSGVFLFLVIVFSIMVRVYHYKIHIRHHHLAMILFALTRFQNALSAISQGILCGVIIEGICTTGLFFLFKKKANGSGGPATRPLAQALGIGQARGKRRQQSSKGTSV
jgi:hypothetical protein